VGHEPGASERERAPQRIDLDAGDVLPWHGPPKEDGSPGDTISIAMRGLGRDCEAARDPQEGEQRCGDISVIERVRHREYSHDAHQPGEPIQSGRRPNAWQYTPSERDRFHCVERTVRTPQTVWSTP